MAKRGRSGRHGNQAAPGRVRIVAGKWRGRFLPVADAPGLRPTSDRIRETLFNWLSPVIADARCLDLFAGTGALGLEAASRGAREVVLVESSPPVAAMLERSLSELGADNASVRTGDAFAWLREGPPRPFDIVFLDPPYALESLTELCRLLARNSWLADGASIYLEQDIRDDRPALPDNFTVLREKTAGSVRYALVRAAAE